MRGLARRLDHDARLIDAGGQMRLPRQRVIGRPHFRRSIDGKDILRRLHGHGRAAG